MAVPAKAAQSIFDAAHRPPPNVLFLLYLWPNPLGRPSSPARVPHAARLQNSGDVRCDGANDAIYAFCMTTAVKAKKATMGHVKPFCRRAWASIRTPAPAPRRRDAGNRSSMAANTSSGESDPGWRLRRVRSFRPPWLWTSPHGWPSHPSAAATDNHRARVRAP